MRQVTAVMMEGKEQSAPRNIPVIKTNHSPSNMIEEKKPKSRTDSTCDLPSVLDHRDELFVDNVLRRRSNSAPLTLEASGIASKLRQASDSFNSAYEKKGRGKRRRVTVGGQRMHDKRRSWPVWNSQISEEGEDKVFQYSSSVPIAGSSV